MSVLVHFCRGVGCQRSCGCRSVLDKYLNVFSFGKSGAEVVKSMKNADIPAPDGYPTRRALEMESKNACPAP